MPTVKAPLISEVYSGIDGSVLNDKSAAQYNGYVDELGGLNVRPGITRLATTAARNLGFYYVGSNAVVPQDGAVERFTVGADGSLTSAGTYAIATLTAGVKATFAFDGEFVNIANGGTMHRTKPSVVGVQAITDADAPTVATHCAFLDGYVLANNGTNKFYWCDAPAGVTDSTSWSALSFASAVGNPDIISSLHVFQRQIYLLGPSSTEVWENDGVSPFSRVPGGYLEIGTLAPYSVVKLDDSMIWLGSNRYFVRVSGRSIEKISSPFDTAIASFSSVTDCYGDRVDVGGKTYCVFQFPTVGRTLAYEPSTNMWSDWGIWNTEAGQWQPFDFTSATYFPQFGTTYITGAASYSVGKLDPTNRADELTIDGASVSRPVKFLRQTGHIDYGTSRRKRSNELRFRAKRGDTASTGSPVLMVRWRDNGSSTWSNLKEIDLGAAGDTNHIVRLRRTGIYTTRQYEFSATDAVGIVISDVEEDIDVL